MAMQFDFGSYVHDKKSGPSGERGEGYAYEGDLRVLRKMRTLKPVEVAVGQTVKLSKEFLTNDLLGNAVKVGPQQFPRIHRITRECAQTLGIAAPQVYIVPNIGSINAATYGVDSDAFIMVHAATVDALSDEELRFVIGHECGHIQNNHVVYLTTLHMLRMILQVAAAGVLLAPLLMPATLALQGWARAAEVTCDRAGLLCCKDPTVATHSFVKLAIGSRRLFDQMNVDVYLEQLKEAKGGYGRMGELQRSHPYLTKRIEALRVFAESALYRSAVGLAGGVERDELERRTEEIVRVM
jgi:Zn-dependent protease with chaperone function